VHTPRPKMSVVKMAGQTINDRLLAARHSLAGQGLAKSVCKATTEELIGPKKKHLDCKYTISRLNFPNPKSLSRGAAISERARQLFFELLPSQVTHSWSEAGGAFATERASRGPSDASDIAAGSRSVEMRQMSREFEQRNYCCELRSESVKF
jgi:hypothetical protein